MRGSMRPRLTAGDEWSHHRPPSEVRKAIGDHSAPCNPVSNQPCHERAVGPRRGRTRLSFAGVLKALIAACQANHSAPHPECKEAVASHPEIGAWLGVT